MLRRSARRWRWARARPDDKARDHPKGLVTQDGAGDPNLHGLPGRGPVTARAAAGGKMDMWEPEGTAPIVGHEIVLETPDVPHHQPDPLGRGHFDRRWQERVLGHGDDDLSLGRWRASNEEHAAHQKTQSQQARPS